MSVIQVARDFLHEPHAGDVLQETIGTVSAPLIREVRFVGGTVIYRCVVFDTDQRPSAAAEVGPFPAQRRHADDGGCRIVCRCSNHFDFGQIIAFRQISLHIADFRSWHNQFRELLSRDAHKFKQVGVELAGFEIQHLRRGHIRHFTDHFPGQAVRQIIRYHQNFVRPGQQVLVLFIQLVQSIEVQELDARFGVDCLFVDLLRHFFHRIFRAFVPVTDRQLQQLAVRSDQAVVDSPRIDSKVAFRHAECLEFG